MTGRPVRPTVLPPDGSLTSTGPDDLPDPVRRLQDAWQGGPAVQLLVPDAGTPSAGGDLAHHEDDPADPTVVLLGTSGSTGTPKQVLLQRSALLASTTATADVLGGAGGWLLALPAHHVAGLQVVLRALLAGTPLVAMDTRESFSARAFRRAADALRSDRRYVSLVPVQLLRLLDDDAATGALAAFDAVLVGGAATAPSTVAAARAAGVRVVTTYGMSETCGGCVYDDVPLPGVSVAADQTGRLRISGPVVARGYRGRPDDPAFPRPGLFVTGDLGAVGDGRVRVLGRADDVIVSGGENVAPALVERALAALPGIGDVVVVGVPDARWGSRVVALVTGTAPDDATLRGALADLPGSHRPRPLLAVPSLPQRGPGKTDRRASAALAAALLDQQDSDPTAGDR